MADPRPEHVRAISWLNESSEGNFYLLRVEAIKVGESPPAPLLTLIVGPSQEAREVGDTKRELAERHMIRRGFWVQLLERARVETQLHANISPGYENWIGTSAGVRGLGLNYAVRQHEAQAELYIDRGKDCEQENKAMFDALHQSREAIDAAFGGPLLWERLEGKRACRISKVIDTGGYKDEEKWPEMHEAMIDAMICLEKALRPHIDELEV